MKTNNKEIKKPASDVKIKHRGGNSVNSFLAGAATVLVLLTLGVGGFLLYRAWESGQISNRLNLTNKNNTSVAPTTQTPVSPSPESSAEISQNPYVQSAMGNKAQVELLSVTRIADQPDQVNVQVRVRRITQDFTGSDAIAIGATTARNPITNEIYTAVDPLKLSSGPIFLFNLGKEKFTDGYVVLNVPKGVKLIDISIKDTDTFKNVLVSEANSSNNSVNNSSANSTSQITLPVISPSPTPNSNDSPNNSSLKLAEKIPVLATNPTRDTPINRQNTATKTPAPQATTAISSLTALPSPNSSDIPSTQFSQLVYGAKAQVQLLSVKRIKDPQTGKQNVVNIKMRIRSLEDNLQGKNTISVGETTARNPLTNEIYKAVNPRQNSTSPISLNNLREGASVDAYVWLKVPENVKNLDIFIPETSAFTEVPISD